MLGLRHLRFPRLEARLGARLLGLGLVCTLGAATACASASTPPPGYLGVRVLDATSYATYAWLAPSTKPAPAEDDVRALRRAAMDKRIRELVERELQAKGYTPAGEGEAALLVDYHTAAVGEANFEADAATETYVMMERGGVVAPPQTGRELSHGALIVDLVDAETMRLLWRGWSQTQLDQLDAEEAVVAERVDTLILEVLQFLPSKN